MSKELVPNIRFKGFDGEWKESLLNEKLIPSREKNTQEVFSKDDVLSVSGDYGVVNQLKFKGRSFAGVSVAPYGVVHINDVVYTKSPLKKQPYGIIKTNKGIDGIVSKLYAIYSCAKEVYPNFVEDYFNSDERLNSYLRPLVRKGAKNDMKISLEGALAGKVWFPEYEEQKMISTFFDILAKEIISVQTKLDKLYALKKTMLVKMFPQGDALVPEIRLKGFTGEWKCSPAKEIFKSVADKNHPDLPVLSASQEFGMIKRDEVGKIVAHDKSSEATYKRVLPGQFVIHLRSFQGGFAHSAYEGITSPAYTVMDFKEKELHDDMYWKYVFMTKIFIIRLETVTYGIRDGRSISFADYSSLEMKYPDVREQAAIGQYFQTLDKQLRLYEHKLSKLNNLKSAFLKNMFV